MGKYGERNEGERAINERAAKDKSFKEQLMKNPHKALEELGLHFPASLKIHVRNEEPWTWELVLREPRPNLAKMSEEELRKASGGGPDCWPFSI